MARANVTEDVVDTYFDQLSSVFDKYNLRNSPNLVYNIDESGFSPEHNPQRIVYLKGKTPTAIASPRSTMVTCIGAVNAIGNAIPPFLVHKGVRFTDDLIKGATPGCDVVMSKNGWSNSNIFQKYLETHFVKFVNIPRERHILILYDGSTTHISASVIEWARSQNIILFVQPPYSSHFLQPLDVSVFGPLKNAYNARVQTYLRQHPGQVVNRYAMTSLICKAYLDATKPSNIISAFRKTGIFPSDRHAIDDKYFKPSESTVMSENVSNNNSHSDELEQFLASFKPVCNLTKSMRKRQSVTGVITDDCVLDVIKERDAKKK